jgi:hypothetical protein
MSGMKRGLFADSNAIYIVSKSQRKREGWSKRFCFVAKIGARQTELQTAIIPWQFPKKFVLR